MATVVRALGALGDVCSNGCFASPSEPAPAPTASAAPAARENMRCVKDSFGNLSCTDGTRVLRDSFGNVVVVPGRRSGPAIAV
jgi:hypothetical protein